MSIPPFGMNDTRQNALLPIEGWVEGLEPSVSRTTIWRVSQLRHTHHTGDDYVSVINVPVGIRTPDPRLRRPMLYPAELRTHKSG